MFHSASFRWAAAAGFCALLGVASAQTKLAVINVQSAVVSTAEIKKAQGDLTAKFRPRQQQMENLQKELQGIQSQLQAGQGKLSPQTEADLNTKGQRSQRELQRLDEDLRQDVDRDRNEVLQKCGARMTEVVRKLAEERGLDVVVDTVNTMYYKPALDITKDAVAAYDKAYPPK